MMRRWQASLVVYLLVAGLAGAISYFVGPPPWPLGYVLTFLFGFGVGWMWYKYVAPRFPR